MNPFWVSFLVAGLGSSLDFPALIFLPWFSCLGFLPCFPVLVSCLGFLSWFHFVCLPWFIALVYRMCSISKIQESSQEIPRYIFIDNLKTEEHVAPISLILLYIRNTIIVNYTTKFWVFSVFHEILRSLYVIFLEFFIFSRNLALPFRHYSGILHFFTKSCATFSL